MNKVDKLIGAIQKYGDKKTSAYDTQAEVRRVEGDTVWVHFPGGVDETPVQRTIDCSAGDTVQVRVGGGTAWIVGNGSAPPTDDRVARAARAVADSAEVAAVEAQQTADYAGGVAEGAKKIADNTAQYFWFEGDDPDETGAHITEYPQEEWKDSTSAHYHAGGNLLARSNGIAVRDGMTALAQFGASFSTIGQTSGKHVEIDTDSIDIKSGSDVLARFGLDHYGDASVQFGDGDYSRISGGYGAESGHTFSFVGINAYQQGNTNQSTIIQGQCSDGSQTVTLAATSGSKNGRIYLFADSSSSGINMDGDVFCSGRTYKPFYTQVLQKLNQTLNAGAGANYVFSNIVPSGSDYRILGCTVVNTNHPLGCSIGSFDTNATDRTVTVSVTNRTSTNYTDLNITIRVLCAHKNFIDFE